MRFCRPWPPIGGGRFWHETTTFVASSRDRNNNMIGPVFISIIERSFLTEVREFHLSSYFRCNLATA